MNLPVQKHKRWRYLNSTSYESRVYPGCSGKSFLKWQVYSQRPENGHALHEFSPAHLGFIKISEIKIVTWKKCKLNEIRPFFQVIWTFQWLNLKLIVSIPALVSGTLHFVRSNYAGVKTVTVKVDGKDLHRWNEAEDFHLLRKIAQKQGVFWGEPRKKPSL